MESKGVELHNFDAVSLTIIIVGLLVCACAVMLITMHPKPGRSRRADKSRLKSARDGTMIDISGGTNISDEVITNVGGIDIALSFAQDIGSREQQQDAYGIYQDDGRLLLIVCDGMGGMAMGDDASLTAVKEIKTVFSRDKSDSALINAVRIANTKVYELCKGMGGTTCVAGVINNNGLSYAGVGDSRICLLQNGEFVQLGLDHIFLYDLLENANRLGITKEDAYGHPESEHLTSFIGRETLGRVNKSDAPIALKSGDVVILYSDGLYKTIDEKETEMLLKSGASAGEIVKMALSRKKPRQDNLTVVKVRVL